jgi:hypothetical protein
MIYADAYDALAVLDGEADDDAPEDGLKHEDIVMQKRSRGEPFGDYTITVTVEGPCRDQVVSAFEFIWRASQIRARDFPTPDPEAPKKPCGCSGS